MEKTFVSSKTEYLIYHSERSSDDGTNIIYLTPVKLDWILTLNPIFAYYIAYEPDKFLSLNREVEHTEKAKQITMEIKRSFDPNTLFDYLNTLDMKYMVRIVQNNILKKNN